MPSPTGSKRVGSFRPQLEGGPGCSGGVAWVQATRVRPRFTTRTLSVESVPTCRVRPSGFRNSTSRPPSGSSSTTVPTSPEWTSGSPELSSTATVANSFNCRAWDTSAAHLRVGGPPEEPLRRFKWSTLTELWRCRRTGLAIDRCHRVISATAGRDAVCMATGARCLERPIVRPIPDIMARLRLSFESKIHTIRYPSRNKNECQANWCQCVGGFRQEGED